MRVPGGFVREEFVFHFSRSAELFYAHLPEGFARGVYAGRIADVPDSGFGVILVNNAPGVVIVVLAQGGEHESSVQRGIRRPVKSEDAEVNGSEDGSDDDRGVDPEEGPAGLQHSGDFRGGGKLGECPQRAQQQRVGQDEVQDHGELAQIKAESPFQRGFQIHQVPHIVREVSDDVNQGQDGRAHHECSEPGARHIPVHDAGAVVEEHARGGEKAAEEDQPGAQKLCKRIFGRRAWDFPLHLGPFPRHQEPGRHASQHKQGKEGEPLAEMLCRVCHEKKVCAKNARSRKGNKALFPFRKLWKAAQSPVAAGEAVAAGAFTGRTHASGNAGDAAFCGFPGISR